MRFLFISPGYPGLEGIPAGSGIGTYVRDLTVGLTKKGHACDVVVHGCNEESSPRVFEGVGLFTVPRGYWPIVERFLPESRQSLSLLLQVRELDKKNRYDWIEIENSEGLEIALLATYPSRAFLRVHTTLAQMVQTKRVRKNYRVRYYLARERLALKLARRILVNSYPHAVEVRRLFPWVVRPVVHYEGRDCPTPDSRVEPGSDPTSLPTFLVLGTADLRKGFDRLIPSLAAFVRLKGPCRCVVVSPSQKSLASFGLNSPPSGVNIVWKSNLSEEDLFHEYANASALLHLARYESFGYPLIESAAVGTPVVATATGIASELLKDDLQDFLVDGDSPCSIAHALCLAIDRRDSIGQVLRQRYEKLFTTTRMVDSYLEILTSWK